MDPLNDPFKSEPIPAISPTLSPTLSAIVAGFLGSSSGMPVSTFPTRSKIMRRLIYVCIPAPTSAAFVNIPPPTLEKKDTVVAPIPNPAITPLLLNASSLKIKYNTLIPSNPLPTTESP